MAYKSFYTSMVSVVLTLALTSGVFAADEINPVAADDVSAARASADEALAAADEAQAAAAEAQAAGTVEAAEAAKAAAIRALALAEAAAEAAEQAAASAQLKVAAAEEEALIQEAESEQIQERTNPDEVMLTFNFSDAMVADVLDYFSAKAGLTILADSYPSGRVNLISRQPISVDDAVTLMNRVLKDKGYSAVRTEDTLRVVSLSSIRYMDIPVTRFNDPAMIPDNENVVINIIPIRFVNAIRLAQDIEPLLSADTILTANEASNSLIVTDTNSNIKRIVRIVNSVDKSLTAVADYKVFVLKYADSQNTADLINNVFEQQGGGSNPFSSAMGGGRTNTGRGGRGGGGMMDMMGGMGGMGGGGGDGAVQNVPVIADADERTNTVVVTGPTEVLKVIASVIAEIDANPYEERSLFIYKLKYANAENIQDRLNNLFQELENMNRQNTRGGTTRGGGFTGASGGSSSSDISDQVYMEADTDTNALVIMTSPKNYEKITKIIDQLDVPIPQVLIQVLIAELTMSDDSDLGVDWTLDSNGDATAATNSFGYFPAIATGGLTSNIITGDLTVTLRALQKQGELNVLSRPWITTSNNQTARINVGQDYPYVTGSTTSSEGGAITSTVQYETIGITLEVTPSINQDDLVIMDINPEITDAKENTIAISSTSNATVFDTRSAECRVAVPDGETIVIGGLMKDKENENVTKVPFLGDIPIIGEAFKKTSITKEKTELLIFLTPQVAKNEVELKKISDHERSKSKFLRDADPDSALSQHIEDLQNVYQSDEPDEPVNSHEPINW